MKVVHAIRDFTILSKMEVIHEDDNFPFFFYKEIKKKVEVVLYVWDFQ